MGRAFCLCMIAVLLWVGSWQSETLQTMSVAPADKWILIEVDLKRLTLYEGTKVLKRYPIASGAWSTPSPLGMFTVVGRFKTEMSGFGTRFLKINVPYGLYGIHGTNKPESIGNNASHGCFRLRVKDAEELYDLTPNGTKVYVEGGPYGLLGDGLRTLKSGDRNSHVMEVQKRLLQQAFYSGSIDGIYGESMSKAVLAARKAYGLAAVDTVDAALYAKLGIVLFE
ncbi:MAG: L,D-transpeptidase family protein [Clostridia bacterium]|nr:L,D-transpeptidase family protein [Clostridia bacterium]